MDDPDIEQELARRVGASRDAAANIVPNRRRLDEDQAHRLVIEAYARHGVAIRSESARELGLAFLRPYWPLLHPIRAHRKGMRFGWPWQADD